MPTVELDDAEWSQVISIIASSHPLVAKIAPQLVAQRNANAAQAGLQPGNGQLQHPGNDPVGASSPAGGSGSLEQRPARPARR